MKLLLLGLTLTPLGDLFYGLLAQEQGAGGTDYVDYLLKGGPATVILFLVVTDKITTPGERDRLRAELTAAHERESRLNDNLRLEIVPALTKNVDALAYNADAFKDFGATVEKLKFLNDALNEARKPGTT